MKYTIFLFALVCTSGIKAQNLGIGTTTPSNPLTVVSGISGYTADISNSYNGGGLHVTSNSALPTISGANSTLNQAPGVYGSTNGTWYGINIANSSTGVLGEAINPGASLNSSGVKGINYGTSSYGAGVIGYHAGSGYGVYGETPNGIGGYFTSNNSTGLVANTNSGSDISLFQYNGTTKVRVDNTGKGYFFGGIQIQDGNQLSGKVLTATDNLGNTAWQMPSPLTLPYNGTSSSGSQNGFSVLATGAYGAGYFENNNASGTNPALSAVTNGGGSALYVSKTNSLGFTALIQNTSTGNGTVLSSQSSGSGSAVDGVNFNNGPAGRFTITSGSSIATALTASTSGTGMGLSVNCANASGNVAQFTNASATVAQIDKTGKGYFFGGIQIQDGNQAAGKVLTATDASGNTAWQNATITLPYSGANGGNGNIFSVTASTASASGSALYGSSNSTVSGTSTTGATAVYGELTALTGALTGAAVRGVNRSTSSGGIGVLGYHAGNGDGVYGESVTGTGVRGASSSGNGIYGISTSTANSGSAITGATAVLAELTPTSGGSFSAAVRGINHSTSGSGIGVVGYQAGNGWGVYGESPSGTGVYATSASGTGAFVSSSSGTPLFAATMTGTNIAVFQTANVNKARIDNTGKGFFNGGTQTGGADLAESFAVEGIRAAYEPGDVLAISTGTDRTLTKSSGPYSKLVVGVYATKPGVLLTEKGVDADLSGEVPLGVVGVIPTKVCNEGGIIYRGDLLVTSSKPGYAMKADEDKIKPGMQIGKALADMSGESGLIEVLVNVR